MHWSINKWVNRFCGVLYGLLIPIGPYSKMINDKSRSWKGSGQSCSGIVPHQRLQWAVGNWKKGSSKMGATKPSISLDVWGVKNISCFDMNSIISKTDTMISLISIAWAWWPNLELPITWAFKSDLLRLSTFCDLHVVLQWRTFLLNMAKVSNNNWDMEDLNKAWVTK